MNIKKHLLSSLILTSNLFADIDLNIKKDKFSLIISGFTKHFGAEEEMNEKNFGLGIQIELDKYDEKLYLQSNNIVFKDSMQNPSLISTIGVNKHLSPWFSTGIHGGITLREDDGLLPIVAPSFTFMNKYIDTNIVYIPKFAETITAKEDLHLVYMTFTYRFK